ncbi:hypothetical protein OSTOST_18013, partial [Ostertagia ostertagi]
MSDFSDDKQSGVIVEDHGISERVENIKLKRSGWRGDLKARSALRAESERRAVMEHELSLMRDQLLQNANLLASSHFSRSGSMRSDQGRQPFSLLGPDGNSVSLSGGSSDLEEIALILRQQQMINDLRM